MNSAHLHNPMRDALVAEGIGWLLPVVLTVVLIGGYLGMVARRRRAMGRRWSGWRTGAWVAGVVLLASGVSPLMTDLVHTDARGHMVQHLLLGMYAPLGLVLAAPVTLLLGASSTKNRRRIATVLDSFPVRVTSHPMVAGVIDMGGLYVLYLTGLYAASMHSALLHWVINIHFVLAGTLFTWAIVGPDPAPHRPGPRARLVALVLTAASHAYLAKMLYARASALPPGGGHAAAEMEQAAQVMYYGGDLAEIALAVTFFATWYHARSRHRGVANVHDAVTAPA